MDADETPRKPASKATATACQHVQNCLGTLHALLRLIDPASPFQPILLSSIDIVAWLALFGKAAEQLGKSLGELPDPACRDAVSGTSVPFLRLAFTLCQYADLYAFPPAAGLPEEVPELADFSPSAAMCEEDATAISQAADAASRAFDASLEHRKLLCRTLALAAGKLQTQLNGLDGLLRLMKRRCRDSRPFARQYATLTDGLKAVLAALPDPEITPWEKCRISFSSVRYRLETDLLPQLENLIKELGTTSRTASAAPTKPGQLKASTLQAVTPFLEAHGLATSLDAGRSAVQYHTLFRELLSAITAALHRCGSCKGYSSPPQRLTDDIRRLGHEVIRRDVLAAWETALPATEPYMTEAVLAALHHLERPSEEGSGSAGRDRLIFGFSDDNLARWVRSGGYVGADPLAEASKTRAAETKRIGRTLQHLRRVGAAFHDRRQWTPTHARNAKSTQHRLWTVNPLLALLPRIAARLTLPDKHGEESSPVGSRPRPTRRNRGTRPRAKK